ncbi:MAG: hypothetical protein A2908_03960 [Candidatus Staskawiczbacteria bacterium RIFCSPLOWO2_01_FULL_38_12b]|uniref:8-oxo-dGTP diphosphatase n=1 Tax=Candidatus Staskawiczbacteria bacterium RIFCSPLOWO2_01_FULL_38_12b TaxID=1802214 RepID=A0A1G2IDQ4_9BACT|nr:MAG: hypothetical protein A2908_03960 [Candidatus Staskawiczbacteria bacterium RIFCSPLOWO2_01_FULL_38_12b]
MEKKRNVSVLIPCRIQNKQVFVYLQKREKNRKVLPDHFGFFGGKIEERETPAQALEREIQEEMCFVPKGCEFLSKYDFIDWSSNVYFLEVNDNFEKEVKIMEGEYGKFFSEKEALSEPMLTDDNKDILRDLYVFLKKGNE